MKLGIMVERIGMYRMFASVIEEALRRNHEVVCFHNYGHPRNGTKGYAFPSADKVPAFNSGTPCIVPYNGRDDFLKLAKLYGIDVVLTGYFHEDYKNMHKRLKNIPWASLQHSLDTVVFSEYLREPDINFMYSEKWLDWSAKYLQEVGKLNGLDEETFKNNMRFSTRFTGYVEPDQRIMVNPEYVRKEWNIPRNKQIVLLIPFDIRYTDNRFYADFIYSMNTPWLQKMVARIAQKSQYIEYIERGWNEENMVKSIREFCDNNNAYLLVKAQRKSPPSKHLMKVADKVLYDESYYPADIHKCLSISDICINFFSTVSTIVVPSGVPNICILPDREDIITTPKLMPIYEMYKELFDFKGASYILGVGEAIEELPNRHISDFPSIKEKREEYVKKFLTYNDGKASSRVLDELERMK